MPSRNSRKEYVPDSYYHVYNRGVEKRRIFLDEQDYAVFLHLLKRHLDSKEHKDKSGRPYSNYRGDVDLLAFCLMPNHFHLLVYQKGNRLAITALLRSVCTAYTMYFNGKYKRVGHLFQERYKASRISQENYLLHVSRYIHLNPSNYLSYEWSSLPYFMGRKQADWIVPESTLSLFEGVEIQEYLKFLSDYEGHKAMLEEIKYELADQVLARPGPANLS